MMGNSICKQSHYKVLPDIILVNKYRLHLCQEKQNYSFGFWFCEDVGDRG